MTDTNMQTTTTTETETASTTTTSTTKTASKKAARKWAVVNKKTGKVASTRESGYNRVAKYSTRREAREALRSGKVFADSKHGTVRKLS